jgi:dethiobiotin synthetase
MNYFITGIGTNVGKTIASAILTEALQADYWKPIQSGTNEGKDSDTIRHLLSNKKTIIHPELYLLKEPLSPHFAAKIDDVKIELDKIILPQTNNNLIIEGAGGILVPINNHQFVIDIAKKINCEVILVISNYLGCINHSLLSIDYLKNNHLKIKTLIFNGSFEEEVKSAIINYDKKIPHITIPIVNDLRKDVIKDISKSIYNSFINTL